MFLLRRVRIVFICLLCSASTILSDPNPPPQERCLLYSTSNSINLLLLNPSELHSEWNDRRKRLVTWGDLGEVSHFDYIHEDATLFWVDLLEEKIKMVQLLPSTSLTCNDEDDSGDDDVKNDHHHFFNVTNFFNTSNDGFKCNLIIENLNITDLFSVSLMPYDGFACDWMSRNLYWIDSEEGRIEVGRTDGKWRKTLVWSDLDQPRDLFVDPIGRYMYWLDVGMEPRIERCGLDGSDRSILVKRPQIGHPIYLTLDLIGQNMYWLDKEPKGIYYADLSGNNVRQLYHSNTAMNPSFMYSFSMVIGTDSMYFVDNRKLFIKMANKFNFSSQQNVWKYSKAPKMMRLLENQVILKGNTNQSSSSCETLGCSHMCLSSPSHPFLSCACPSGVVLLPDNKTCSDGPSQMLIFARQTDIRKISLDTADFTDTLLTNEDRGMMVAVDYDPVEEKVYWTDVDLHVIKRANINGDEVEVVLEEGIHTPEGIAIDWISRLIYWTDTRTDLIEVSDIKGTMRKVVIRGMLDEPRALVVDPYEGILFWSDWGIIKRIERSRLDGSNRKTVIDWLISWPNGLALDRSMKRLYWADAQLDLIESCGYDGTNRRQIITDDIPHAFGLALIGDHIYWTEWHRRVLERANKITGKSRLIIIEELPNMMGLAAVHSKMSHNESSENMHNECLTTNGGCSHFCFRLPGEGHRCSCPESLTLSEVNHRICHPKPAFILFNNGSLVIKRLLSSAMTQDDNGDAHGLQLMAEEFYDDEEDDDDDDEGSHGTGNFLSDYYYKEEGDDDNDNNGDDDDGGRLIFDENKSEKKLLLLEYMLSEDVILKYDVTSMTMSKLAMNLSSDSFDPNTTVTTMTIPSLNHNQVQKYLPVFALDWLSGNIYWTDWDKIEMTTRHGLSRLVIIWQNCRPRTLSVDPLSRFLFWSNEMNSFGTIERSSLDGSSRVIIVRNVSHVTGITLDPKTQQLYWTDQKLGLIEYCSYDGSNRAVLLSNVEPYRITLFEDFLYWSNADGQIIATNRMKGGQKVIVKGLNGLVDVKVIHPSLQKGYNFCSMSKNNGGCSDLCISLEKGDVTHKCACTSQYVLSRKDNKSCEASNVAAYLATSNKITSLSLEELLDFPDVGLPFQSSSPLRSLEFDPFEDLVYFMDGSNKISTMKSNGSQVTTLFDTTEQDSPVARMVPFDMVLDHAHDLLYWSDLTFDTIVMTQIKEPISHFVLNLPLRDGLKKPKYLALMALNSDRSILFWTSGQSIEGGQLEPSTSKDISAFTVLSGFKVGPLCVDASTNYLYWFNVDAHSIEMLKLNGEKRVVVVEGVRSCTGIGISGSHLYWVDKEKQTLESCLKGSGKQRSIIRDRLPTGLKDLVVVNRKKLLKSPRMVELLRGPIDDPMKNCPFDHFSCHLMRYEQHSIDGHENSFKNQHIREGRDDWSDLTAKDVECIPFSWKCDGNVDCIEAVDEVNCTLCKGDSMLCAKDKKCIGKGLICNGKIDCSDGSDEKGCMFCLGEQFSTFDFKHSICHPGFCYSIGHACDGFADCENGMDEVGCNQMEAIEWKRGFNFWLIVVAVVFSGALTSIAIFVFFLKQKSECRGRLLKFKKGGLVSCAASEPKTSNQASLGTSFLLPIPRYMPPKFSNEEHLLSASSSTLNAPPEKFGGPYPSLATSFADSGLTSADKSYRDGIKRKKNRGMNSSLGDESKHFDDKGWQYCDNLYFPYDGQSNTDEIPALPPPPPSPCSQSRLIRSRQTSSTGSSTYRDQLITPINSSPVQVHNRNHPRQRSHFSPQLDFSLDPCLVLPPSGRSSLVSKSNGGTSEHSRGGELRRLSTPISGSSRR